MSEQLFTYLELRFYKENHARYHKYFKEWIENVNTNQLFYFQKEMNNLIK